MHSHGVLQLAEQTPTPTITTTPLPKDQRRMEKAYSLMELQTTTMQKEQDVALHVKEKVCSSDPVKLKVLILSDATPKHKAKYPTFKGMKTLSEGFTPEHYDVTPTYFHDPKVYDTDEVLPSPWHQTDINNPQTYPSEQFEMILGRNLICFCHTGSRSCGGILKNDKAGATVLTNLALRLSTKKGSRAILTIPENADVIFHASFWGTAIKRFNSSQSDFVALPITSQTGFYGIKIKPIKK